MLVKAGDEFACGVVVIVNAVSCVITLLDEATVAVILPMSDGLAFGIGEGDKVVV